MTNEMLIYNEQINQEANVRIERWIERWTKKNFFQDNQRNFGEKFSMMNSKDRE